MYNIFAYPTNIIIDKRGNFYNKIIGENYNIGILLSQSIKEALNNKKSVPHKSINLIMISPSSKFKDEKGNNIPYQKANEMLRMGKYDLEKYTKNNGEEYFILKKMK